MKDVSTARDEPLASALRAILIEDPARIEGLSQGMAARIDTLLEANGLEALVYDTVRREGSADAISPDRHSAWKTAWLMAGARWTASRGALQELFEIASEGGMDLQVSGGAAFALRVYSRPELRPAEWVEAAVEESRAADLILALESGRWSEVGSLEVTPREEGTTSLFREGVELRVKTLPLLRGIASAEYLGAGLSGPPIEALCVLNAREMARRRYGRSLYLLHDIALALADSRLSGNRMARLAAENGLELETALALDLAREVLGSEAKTPPAGSAGLPEEEWNELRKLCLSAVLSHPADLKVHAAIALGLEAHSKAGHQISGM